MLCEILATRARHRVLWITGHGGVAAGGVLESQPLAAVKSRETSSQLTVFHQAVM